MSASILSPVRATFRAAAVVVVPETSAVALDVWADIETKVETALSARPLRMQRQFVLLLRVIEYLPLLRYLRPFSRLPEHRRLQVLWSLQNSRYLLVRRGFWGLRTLIFLGYYSRADVQAALGYRAHADGWGARRAERPSC